MRELTDHKVNPANDVLTVSVLDEPGSGREVSRTDAWRMACEQASQQAAKVIKAQQELASAQ